MMWSEKITFLLKEKIKLANCVKISESFKEKHFSIHTQSKNKNATDVTILLIG